MLGENMHDTVNPEETCKSTLCALWVVGNIITCAVGSVMVADSNYAGIALIAASSITLLPVAGTAAYRGGTCIYETATSVYQAMRSCHDQIYSFWNRGPTRTSVDTDQLLPNDQPNIRLDISQIN